MKIVMCIIGMILVTKAIYPVGMKLIKPAWSRKQNIRRQVLIVAASFAAEAAAAVMYTRLGMKALMMADILQVSAVYIITFVLMKRKYADFPFYNIFAVLFPVSQLLLLRYIEDSTEYNNVVLVAVTMISGLLVDCVLMWVLFSMQQRGTLQNDIDNRERELALIRQKQEKSSNEELLLETMKEEYSRELKEIYDLYEKKMSGGLNERLDRLEEKIKSTKEFAYCGNVVVDVILKEKAYMCECGNIDFETDVRLGETSGISNLHLCSVFTNLLNNAIQACSDIDDRSRRHISVKCDMRGDYLCVVVRNTVNAQAKKQMRKAPRPGHGYGLRILNDIAEKYNGKFGYKWADGEFQATMQMLVPKQVKAYE